MPERLSSGVIDIAQRQALITALPAFAMLTPEESEELAVLMYEIRYMRGEIVVAEGALVDSILIIAQGQAEASRQYTTKNKITKKVKVTKSPLGTLNPGDGIGINSTGFFSTTGQRTATVIATSPVHLLALDLKNLHTFLQVHPHVQSAMYLAAGEILRIRLIKQSLPFSRLSYERLQRLANQVEEIKVPAGTEIFKQGEIGDRCYLIRTGQIEIVAKNNEGEERRLALLKPPTLFGEATLITQTPRNATARAIEDCELLMLRNEYLSELIESENNVADMFMSLMVDRSRPMQNPHVIKHDRKTADEQPIVILKNPDNGNYFKLSEEGWFIWEQLNGKQTMQQITLALSDKFNIFAPDVVAALISKLAKAGFVTNVEVGDDTHLSSKPLWIRTMVKIKRVLEARVAIGDADVWLTSLYNKGAYLLFKPLGLILLATLAIGGMVAFGFAMPHVIELYKTIPNSWVLFLLLIPFTIISVGLHELGHALATKAFGQKCITWEWAGIG